MKIKKIPFPAALKILCGYETRGSISVGEGANTWNIWMRHRIEERDYHLYIIWYCNNKYMWTSDELSVYDTAPPDEADPLIREWYKKACAEMQEVFDNFVKENFLEEDNNEQED